MCLLPGGGMLLLVVKEGGSGVSVWRRSALVGFGTLTMLVSTAVGARAPLGALASDSPAGVPVKVDRATRQPAAVIANRMLLTKAGITEIAAHGGQVAALVPIVTLDQQCARAFVWNVPKRTLVQISDGYQGCGGNGYTIGHDLSFSGNTVAWWDFWCGNEAYDDPVAAVLPRRVARSTGPEPHDLGACVGVAEPKPQTPRGEKLGGLGMTPRETAILIRRLRDGRARTLRAPAHIVDADLTTAGLFYAYNTQHQRYSGHLVFVPYSQLFR